MADKKDMYSWVDAAEDKLDEIREHIDELPEVGERSWTDEDFLHVAQIYVCVRELGGSCRFIAKGIFEILTDKIRVDASKN